MEKVHTKIFPKKKKKKQKKEKKHAEVMVAQKESHRCLLVGRQGRRDVRGEKRTSIHRPEKCVRKETV